MSRPDPTQQRGPSGGNSPHLGKSLRSTLAGLLIPSKVIEAIRLHRGRGGHSRTKNDDQLKLYSEILTGDFLHYGYFDDPATRPEEISLAGFERAQTAYANLFVDRIKSKKKPVLDVGCGMGGLIGLRLLPAIHP